MKIFKILGIDPGLNKTGWGIVTIHSGHYQYIDSGVITTNLSNELQTRLLHIFNNINKIILLYQPNETALEETYVNINSKSSLHLAHARAAAMLAAANAGLRVTSYQAKTIKKTLTGTGAADKEQVAKVLNMRLTGCTAVKDQNAIDALALAFCHANYL